MFEPRFVFPVFIVTWIILGAGGFLFFYLGKNGRLKRILWPFNVILVGVLFIVFVYLIDLPSNMLVILIPMIVLISVMNLFMVRFCLSCGGMMICQNPLARPNRCPKCNMPFKQEGERDADDINILREENNRV